MGRASQFNRTEAIEMVMQQIWQKGYEACSVKALSESLGITRSSFYHAFGTRESLFKEALEAYFKQSPAAAFYEANENTAIAPLLTQTFRKICVEASQDQKQRGCMLVNCTAELGNVHPDLSPYIAEANLAITEHFETMILWAIKQDEISGDTDVRATALILQNLLNGIYMMSKLVSDEKELWAMTSLTLIGLKLYDTNLS